jgi:hypothetical protein
VTSFEEITLILATDFRPRGAFKVLWFACLADEENTLIVLSIVENVEKCANSLMINVLEISRLWKSCGKI